jgi:hypothetical protein
LSTSTHNNLVAKQRLYDAYDLVLQRAGADELQRMADLLTKHAPLDDTKLDEAEAPLQTYCDLCSEPMSHRVWTRRADDDDSMLHIPECQRRYQRERLADLAWPDGLHHCQYCRRYFTGGSTRVPLSYGPDSSGPDASTCTERCARALEDLDTSRPLPTFEPAVYTELPWGLKSRAGRASTILAAARLDLSRMSSAERSDVLSRYMAFLRTKGPKGAHNRDAFREGGFVGSTLRGLQATYGGTLFKKVERGHYVLSEFFTQSDDSA